MAEIRRIGDLDIDEDMQFQRRSWALQRVGWMAMLLVVVAGLLGIFGGDGALNQASLGAAASTLRVTYTPFTRVISPMKLHFQIQDASGADQTRIWISRDYLDEMEIRTLEPEAESVEVTSDRLVYTFRLGDINTPAGITFMMEPQRVGSLSGRIGVEGGDSYEFTQFVFP
jgi:hypothetical protein